MYRKPDDPNNPPLKALPRKRPSIVQEDEETMVHYISGVKVELPKSITPYSTQKLMMIRILDALKHRHANTLVESPTGSGKTLALLAATCSWLRDYKPSNTRQKRIEAKQSCPVHGGASSIKADAKKVVKRTSAADITEASEYEPDDTETFQRDLAQATATSLLEQCYEPVDCFEPVEKSAKQVSTDSEGAEVAVDKENKKNACTCLGPTRIYYCTRTHKQIAQVVKEYKRMSYHTNIKHTILASREQSCINVKVKADVKSDRTKSITEECRVLIGPRGPKCEHKEALRNRITPGKNQRIEECLDPSKNAGGGGIGTLRREIEYDVKNTPNKRSSSNFDNSSPVWDIEELVSTLSKRKFGICPYFLMTRELTKVTDIIFCPFNYLVDPLVRRASDVHLKDAVVILDEAHNIEDVCRDGASFDIEENELKETAISLRNEKEAADKAFRMMGADSTQVDAPVDTDIMDQYSQAAHAWLEYLLAFQVFFDRLANRAQAQDEDRFNHTRALTMSWDDLNEELQDVYCHPDEQQHKALSAALETLVGRGESNEDSSQQELQKKAQMLRPTPRAIKCMEKILQFFYFHGLSDHKRYYKGHLLLESTSKQRGGGARGFNSYQTQTQHNNTPAIVFGYHAKLSLWCMMPSIVWSDAFSECRNVILASGTMSPLNTFCSELDTTFRSQMEGKQIIDNSQIFASALSVGPRNNKLCFTYSNLQTNSSMITELAELVVDICYSVPNGVLCFLSSYRMLEQLEKAIEGSPALFKRLKNKKKLFKEPKISKELDALMKNYENAAVRPVSPTDGAIFLAVFRGKVSEGIDFADDKARCVISVGIPYPAARDEQVVQKRAFNDTFAKELGLMSGADWYETQAYRAINQALGRCLRHKKDWGALLMIDERYHRPQPMISGWVRQAMQRHTNYVPFRAALKQFVERNQLRMKQEAEAEAGISVVEPAAPKA